MWPVLIIIGVVYALGLWAFRKVLQNSPGKYPLFGAAYKEMQDQFRPTTEDKDDEEQWEIK